MTNEELKTKYPFLVLRSRWSGEVVLAEEDYVPGTELDEMPDGWRKAFGEQMCEDIYQCLLKANYVEKYRIMQIKEKYGTLRWYDSGAPKEIYDELQNIIEKYSNMSERICIVCGVPADGFTRGWISPYCVEHANGSKLYPFEEIEKESDCHLL